jgi:Putative beta-barrel porin-2, OmpL-like. bbp2
MLNNFVNCLLSTGNLLIKSMIKRLSILLLLSSLFINGQAQVMNTTMMDTIETTAMGHVAVGGYVDTYFGYNFSNTNGTSVPYYVSSARNNQFQINLAYVEVRYRAKGLRAHFAPGVGTYMNDNYRAEPGTLKNIVLANVGVLLSAKRKIWIDMGVFTSHYTNESAISKDHLMYTRSFAPENVPYYLSGVKLSIPLTEKVNSYFFLLNGWQVIEDNNKGKSIGTQIEYQPNSSMLFNWNTYVGDERSIANPTYRTRFFTDVFWVYQHGEKISATSCVYFGWQEVLNGTTRKWWQANIIGRYNLTKDWSLSGRLEYFSDPNMALINPVTSANSFSAFSTGLCANYKVYNNALLRFELKQLFSSDNMFFNSNNQETKSNLLGVVSLAAWF